MKTQVLMGVAVLAAGVLCGQDEVHPEATPKLTPEALERYSAPGEPARYVALLKQLRRPAEELGSPAKNLRLPVQSWPDGRAKTIVFAPEAWVTEDMQNLRGRKVRVEHFKEDGSPAGEMEAEEVVVDRTQMLAVAKGRVFVAFGGDRMQGVGALADLQAQYVRILRRAQIETGRLGAADFTERGMF